jgi:hypothetical protein
LVRIETAWPEATVELKAMLAAGWGGLAVIHEWQDG